MIRDRLRNWWNTYGRWSGAVLRERPAGHARSPSPHH